MAKVRAVNGKRGLTYRVQVMRKGVKFDRTFDTEVEAENFLHLIKTGQPIPDGTPTIKEMAKSYLDDLTIRDWKGALTQSRFWVDEIGDLRASEVSHKLVDEIVDSNPDWSEATKARYRTCLSMIYKNAGMMEFNPARNIPFTTNIENPDIYTNHTIAMKSISELRARRSAVSKLK